MSSRLDEIRSERPQAGRCFVLFDLNLLTLPVLAVARAAYDAVYFVQCSPAVKKHAAGLVRGLGAVQLQGRDHIKGGIHYVGQVNAVRVARAMGRTHAFLKRALARYGGLEAYGDLVDQIFGSSEFVRAYLAPFVARDVAKLAGRYGSVAISEPDLMDLQRNAESPAISARVPLWYRLPAEFIGLVRRLGLFFLCVAFPILNLARLRRKGVRLAAGPVVPRAIRPLFVHRHSAIHGDLGKFRDMYLFRQDILRGGDWSHLPMATSESFDAAKAKWLGDSGGEVISATRFRAEPGAYFAFNIFGFYRHMLPALGRMVFGRGFNFQFVKSLFEYLHLMSFSRVMFENVRPSFVYFETEYSHFGRAAALEARKHGIRSGGYIHSAGIQSLEYIHRMDLQFDDLLTAGCGFAPIRKISPRVKRFIPIGNPELDHARSGNAVFPAHIAGNRSKYKIVAFLADLQTGMIEEESHLPAGIYLKSVTLDDDYIRAHADRMLRPFFQWVADRDDIVLLWKPKRFKPHLNENHPYIRPLIALIPPERLILRTMTTLSESISVSDVCVTSAFSTGVNFSMGLGIPITSLDTAYGKLEAAYDPHMAAESGEELVENLEYVLAHGFPESVFRKFNNDYYGRERVDGSTDRRFSEYFAPRLNQSSTTGAEK